MSKFLEYELNVPNNPRPKAKRAFTFRHTKIYSSAYNIKHSKRESFKCPIMPAIKDNWAGREL